MAAYNGVSKGLAARQWLMQVRSEIAGARLSVEAALTLAGSYLEGRAAAWFHLEDAERPFSAFEETSGSPDPDCFEVRFRLAFIRPGCSTSSFFNFKQAEDTPAEEYIFEKASMAQVAGICFEEAYDHIVEGLHDIFTPVKLAISHHPSTNVVSLVADVARASRKIGLDWERSPSEMRTSPRSGEYTQFQRGRDPFQGPRAPWTANSQRRAIAPVPPRAIEASGSDSVRPQSRDAGQRASPAIRGVRASEDDGARAVTRERPALTAVRGATATSARPAVQPSCWGCGRTGHYRRDCPDGAPDQQSRRENFTTRLPSTPTVNKYLKDCLVNGEFRITGLMDTGCSAVLIRASRVNDLGIRVVLGTTPIYGTGDVSTPATYSLGRVVLDSLQVDEGVATEIEALVVPDISIPEDLCVGRTFLDLPHLSLCRVDAEFFVGPPRSSLEMIRRASTERPLAVGEVEIAPGTAAMVVAKTEPSSVVVVRAEDCDYVYHSNSEGMVQLPVENRGKQSLIVKAGEPLGKCKVMPEEEFSMAELPTDSSTDSPDIMCAGAESKPKRVGCTRKIELDEVNMGPTLSDHQKSQILQLVNKYSDVFSFNLQELGCTDLIEADIQLKPDKMPGRAKPYRLAPEDRSFMETQVREWKDAGIVSDTTSPVPHSSSRVSVLVSPQTKE